MGDGKLLSCIGFDSLTPCQQKGKMQVSTENRCIRCEAELEEGFILDKLNMGNDFAEWVAGSPSIGAKADAGNRHTHYAYRCTKCGRVELFADGS